MTVLIHKSFLRKLIQLRPLSSQLVMAHNIYSLFKGLTENRIDKISFIDKPKISACICLPLIDKAGGGGGFVISAHVQRFPLWLFSQSQKRKGMYLHKTKACLSMESQTFSHTLETGLQVSSMLTKTPPSR